MLAMARVMGLGEAMTPDKELAYQARIRELREALVENDRWHAAYDDYGGYPDSEIEGMNARALSRPDDLSALEAYVREEKRKVLQNETEIERLTKERDEAYERAASACEFYAIEIDGKQYKTGSKNCAIAIRAMKAKETKP